MTLGINFSRALYFFYSKKNKRLTEKEFKTVKTYIQEVETEFGFNPLKKVTEFWCDECNSINLLDSSSDKHICHICSEEYELNDLSPIITYSVEENVIPMIHDLVFKKILSILKKASYSLEDNMILKNKKSIGQVIEVERLTLETINPILTNQNQPILIMSWIEPSKIVKDLLNNFITSTIFINPFEAVSKESLLIKKVDYLKKKSLEYIISPSSDIYSNKGKLLPYYLKLLPEQPIKEMIDKMDYYITFNPSSIVFFENKLSKKSFTEIWVHLWFVLHSNEAIPLANYLFEETTPNPPLADGVFLLPNPLVPSESEAFMYDVTNLSKEHLKEDVDQAYRYLRNDFPDFKYDYYYIFHFTNASDTVLEKLDRHFNKLIQNTEIKTKLVFMKVKFLLRILKEIIEEGISPYNIKKNPMILSKHLFSRFNSPKIIEDRYRRNFKPYTIKSEEIDYLIEIINLNISDIQKYQKKMSLIGYGPKESND